MTNTQCDDFLIQILKEINDVRQEIKDVNPNLEKKIEDIKEELTEKFNKKIENAEDNLNKKR